MSDEDVQENPRSGGVVGGLETLLGLALIVAIVLNFANVVGRYVFGKTFSAADETQVYLLVGMAFLGVAVVTARGLHLRMDVLSTRLPAALQGVLVLVEWLLLIVLGALVAWVSGHYTLQMFQFGAVSENAQIPMWIPHASVAIGFAWMAVLGLLGLARSFLPDRADKPQKR